MDLTKLPIRIVQIMDRENISTNGSATWTPRKFAPKDIQNVGPYLVGMRVHAKLAEKSTNFQYRVVGQWSVDGITWTDFANPLLTTQSADGSVVSSEYTTTTDFGIFIRVSIQASNASGTAVENGVLTVFLVLHYIT